VALRSRRFRTPSLPSLLLLLLLLLSTQNLSTSLCSPQRKLVL
jgi:hypothetical protein